MSRRRTPLRYPGGKQKLAPFIQEILSRNQLINGEYVEPYAGGAGVALELLMGNAVSRIHLNDSYLPIYAFWKSVLDHTEDLCRMILEAPLNVEEWRIRREIVRNPEGKDELELGFSTFYLNRCNRSGILTAGVIGGNDQSGNYKMDARFNKKALIGRIEAIALKKNAITVHNWDAEDYIKQYIPTLPGNTLVYCDPPYYEKASDLYLNHYKKDDHIHIAKLIQEEINHRWVVSYDGVSQIMDYYRLRRSFVYDLQYNASSNYKGKELFIFSDDIEIPATSSLKFINAALPSCRIGTQLPSIEPILARG